MKILLIVVILFASFISNSQQTIIVPFSDYWSCLFHGSEYDLVLDFEICQYDPNNPPPAFYLHSDSQPGAPQLVGGAKDLVPHDPECFSRVQNSELK